MSKTLTPLNEMLRKTNILDDQANYLDLTFVKGKNNRAV